MVPAVADDVASYHVVGVNAGRLMSGGGGAKTGVSVLLPLIAVPVGGTLARTGRLAELAAPECGALGRA